MPAGLVRILLLRAGVESNPGPTPGLRFYCCVCDKVLFNCRSVQCSKCKNWCHFRKNNNCCNLKSISYYTPEYICPPCTNHPSPPPLFPPPPPPSPPPPPPPPPPPTPTPSTYDSNGIKILQFNCNGIKGKLTELLTWMTKEDIKIAAIQETKLNKNSKLSDTPGYTLVRNDRDKDKGGGLAFLIHQNIMFQNLPNPPADDHLEYLAIKVDNLTLINIYIPPSSSCSAGYMPTLAPYLNGNETLLLGDINAHDSLWHSTMLDTRGSNLADEIGIANMGVLNEEVPTRLPTNGQPSSPDLSLASLDIMPYTSWQAQTSMGSDHLPIIITLQSEIKETVSDKRTFTNFKKADWDNFEKMTEKEFADLPTPLNIYEGEKMFRSILNKAAKQTIPAGRIKHIFPNVPSATATKMKERDALRQADPSSPQIIELNKQIHEEINDHKRDKWRCTVEDLNRKTDSSKLFKLIKHLNGGPKANSNQAIKFQGKYHSNPKHIANHFNKQYTSVVRHISSKSNRHVTRNLKKNSLKDPPTFTAEKTKEAIKKAKASKAQGPDELATVHLKHIGPKGLQFLTDLFNLSVATSTIPAIWKSSIVVPLLKPQKPADDSGSYRPVSLLCPAIKILERLLLPTLTEHLPVPTHQHGFRAKHSTVTALNEFNLKVSEGFNKNKPADRTVLLQVDLSKAFDMVSHEKLLKDLNKTTLPDPLKRWFNCYLHGRQSRVNFRNATSSARNVKAGVPQGAVTSPILFNFYLFELPTPPNGIFIVQYADDISVYASGTDLEKLSSDIDRYTVKILDFLRERELEVSPSKSSVTLFTPDTKEANIIPKVIIDGKPVKLDKNPKLLGVYFDTMHSFSFHIKETVKKAKKKVNILKALAGSSWGQDKETLIITYKAIGRSVLEYGAPIWSPIISDSSWNRLQTVQNQALRTATGCLAMSSIPHLHRECKMLPVKEHCVLLTKQFNAACFQNNHPGKKFISSAKPKRNLKPTHLIFKDAVAERFRSDTYKTVIKNLHTASVKETLLNYPPNKVLNAAPPVISKEETTLPRPIRTILSRLRSSYCRSLHSYMARIDNEFKDECPACQQSPHDTNHIFNCTKNPTDLEASSLWTNPIGVAIFLKLWIPDPPEELPPEPPDEPPPDAEVKEEGLHE